MQICIAAQQIGITPLVRVPANTPDYICRVLDGGAMGVITPHIHSAAEAREMVGLVKFPPLGGRSAGGALSQYRYRSFPITETNAAMNDATSLVLMLETAAALENVEEIIAVDGVDMMMIGSNDLCGELGISGQYDHPKLAAAFERAIAAARRGWQVYRRWRSRGAERPDDEVRANGRAVRFHRHRYGVPDGGLCAKSEIRTGYQGLEGAQSHDAVGDVEVADDFLADQIAQRFRCAAADRAIARAAIERDTGYSSVKPKPPCTCTASVVTRNDISLQKIFAAAAMNGSGNGLAVMQAR